MSCIEIPDRAGVKSNGVAFFGRLDEPSPDAATADSELDAGMDHGSRCNAADGHTDAKQ